jgi:hypothetical protein
MGKSYRLWKHLLAFPLVLGALLLMKRFPEFSGPWIGGLVIALVLAAVYLIEEIVWWTGRKGRPCARCGKPVPLKSFAVVSECPHCGLPFE